MIVQSEKLTHRFLLVCLAFLFLTSIPGVVLGGKTRSVIAFGDSLTEGCYIVDGSSDCGAWLGGYGYWVKLKALLADNGFETTVYNHGLGGELTKYGVNRLASLLDNYSCDNEIGYVLILEGTNDLVRHQSVEVITFNLAAMVQNSRNRGVEPLLATIPPDPDNPEKAITELNNSIRSLAFAKEVTLVDIYREVVLDWNSYVPGCYNDRTHPNKPGFDLMGSLWYNGLYDMLKQEIVPEALPWVEYLLLRSP